MGWDKKKTFLKEGLLNFYIVTYITLQTFHQECFFERFVCFIVFIFPGPPSLFTGANPEHT